MTKKNISAVITLVSKNEEHYLTHCAKITNLLDRYKIKKLQTENLSNLVKDFFIEIDVNSFKKIKLALKSKLFEGSDACIQKNTFRKKKVIACDMDRTVISVETLDLIGERLLKNKSISDLTKEAMNGNLNFSKSITKRTEILKGTPIKKIIEMINDIELTKDVKTVIKTMNKFNCHTILISGGYDLIANVIGKKIGFKEIISNKPLTKNGKLTGELKGTIIDGEGKLKYLKNSMKINNANKFQTLAIGDGQNDIEMIKYSGLGICWKGFPRVKKTADAIANNTFKSVLYFQGYNDKEILN